VPSLAGGSAGITKFPETPYKSPKSRATSVGCDRSCANVPQLNTHNIKLLAVVAQRLITERGTRFRDAFLEVVVEPEAIVTIAV
jgi:hypothetical protein